MGDRDPRTDPQPGDVLRSKTGASIFTVLSRAPRTGWGDSVGFHWSAVASRPNRRWKISTWKSAMREAAIVTTGCDDHV